MNFCTPLITNGNASVVRLKRAPLHKNVETVYSEEWLQNLIHDHPTVLPIDAIEMAFTPAISICKELPLPSGFLDNFLITPSGNLIAVECKLWRNPEARRQVVAQVIDYAKDLQRLSFDDLESAIRSSRKQPDFRLYDHVASLNDDKNSRLDEPRFIDAVARNLARGRCLILIVGDGVTEGLEALSAYLQQHAGLHFGLALVQLAIYETPGSANKVIVPSVPLTTTNIVRAVVDVVESKAVVLPPPVSEGGKGKTLTEEQFMAGLDAIRPGTAVRLRAFLDAQQDLRIQYDVQKTLIVRLAMGDSKFIAFVIHHDGAIDTSYVFGQKEIFRPFVQKLAETIPLTRTVETKPSVFLHRQKSNGARLTIWDFMDHANGVRQAFEVLYASVLAHGTKKQL